MSGPDNNSLVPVSGASVGDLRLDRLLRTPPRDTGGVIEHQGPVPAVLAHRRLSSAQAQLQNRLCARHVPISFRVGGGGMLQARISPPHTLPQGIGWLAVTIDGHPARIGISWGAARRLVGLSLETAETADGALLLEDALSDWLDEIEAATGLALRFETLQRTVDAIDDALNMTLDIAVTPRPPNPARRLRLAVELSPHAVDALAPAFDRWQQPFAQPLPLYLRVQAEIDGLSLSLEDLASLRPGDALVTEADPDVARLVVESQFQAPASRVQGANGASAHEWTLEAGFVPRWQGIRNPQISRPTEVPMNDQPETPETPADEASARPHHDAVEPATEDIQPAAPPETMDALTVRLSFRLGETLMTLADLRSAGPGTIITLDRADGALVEILANGQLIGTGEVIAVSGQRAVEIRTLFGEG